MRKLTLIFFFFLSISVNAEPEWGQYKMTGYAYIHDSIPITNDTLIFKIANKEIIVITDNVGKYSVTITWTTWDIDAGMHDSSGNLIDIDKKNEEMNPSILIKHKGKTITIPNYWKEELIKSESERGKTRNIDVKF